MDFNPESIGDKNVTTSHLCVICCVLVQTTGQLSENGAESCWASLMTNRLGFLRLQQVSNAFGIWA